MSSEPVILTSTSPAFPLRQFTIRSQWVTAGAILAVDLLALSLVLSLSVLGRHLLSPAYEFASCLALFPCVIMILVAFWLQGLYPGVLLHPAEEMRRIVFSISIVLLAMASTTFLWRNAEGYSRSVFLTTWAAAPPAVLLTRFLLRRSLARKPWWGVPALVLGSGPTAQRVVSSLRNGMLGVKVTAVLSSEQMINGEIGFSTSSSHAAQYAILAMPEKSALQLRHAIQDYCTGFSHIILVPDIPGLCSQGISAREMGGEFGLELPQRLFHRGAAAIKRIMDLILSALALLILFPAFLFIAIAVKLDSTGPVFYGHPRRGRRGEMFKALKFRTMAPNAAQALSDYLAAHPEQQLEWQRNHKLKDDPRVTTVGGWLRRCSLDELPQLWNVLAGQMSLVGPRPIIQAEVGKYGRGYDLYTRVRPGITGLWQVSGRNNTTYEQRVAFDEYYVRNWSIWLDAYILICTVRAVVTADGAY